ncbi:MAG: hypothetical protein C0169_00325 [Thermodesulfobacterium geofontis]|uniref:Uncharacterized protein n=1 Tax=Thermodesulfobacterium geofontis TaxID=1295609 RepID=A0A2N7QGQ8_9BACT|nr:MAG: hypothetical protein C0169_00325 [Thermodesulfobacterium geofontis]
MVEEKTVKRRKQVKKYMTKCRIEAHLRKAKMLLLEKHTAPIHKELATAEKYLDYFKHHTEYNPDIDHLYILSVEREIADIRAKA